MNPKTTIQPDWKWGTAEGSREFDRLTDRMLTFREVLEWLEEAETLTLRFRSQREAARAAGDAVQPYALNDAPPVSPKGK